MKDPAIASSIEDLQPSTATQVRIRDDITRDVRRWSTEMEIWRKQIEDQVKANAGKAGGRQAAERSRTSTILDVELKLVSRSEMLSDDKYFPEAYKVYMNLIWLSGGVGQGASDEAGSIDYKPTDTQMEVLRVDRKGPGGGEGRVREAAVDRAPGVQQADGREGAADRRYGSETR